MITDFHSHAFPDAIAARAVPALAEEGKIAAHSDGTITGLLASMDQAGIDRSVICSIATQPSQFQAILDWSLMIRSERIIPLASIHPNDPELVQRVEQIRAAGLAGIKMHPYYQNYFLASERLTPLYQALSDAGLLLVVHCGYDVAYPRIKQADPAQILTLHQRFPNLKLVATHFGAWQDWDAVEDLLIGHKIYMEISFSLQYLKPQEAVRLFNAHPSEYLLFGSDSPWADQRECLRQFNSLGLDAALCRQILHDNSIRPL